MSDQVYAYVGKCASCGAVRFAAVDRPEDKRQVARDVAEAIRDGFVVERVTVEAARAMPWACTCAGKGADVASPQLELGIGAGR